MADDGTVCNYGSMTGEDPVMARAAVVFRGVSLRGFMLGRFLAKRTTAQIDALYAKLAAQMRSGALDVPIRRIYPIEEIRAAVEHACRGERDGKILVAPNGPL